MSELAPVLDALLADLDAGRPVALCTVVCTRGSTPRAPGATMLVRADGKTLGTLGGGCVEAEVRKRAFEMLRANRSGLLDFTLDHDYGWDDGLICGGRMFIGVMPMSRETDAAPYRAALTATRARQPATFPIVISNAPPEGKTGGNGSAVTQHSPAANVASVMPRRERYTVHLEVPPTLLIAGAGHVGQALAKLAVDLDFHVVVIDDRADYAACERFDSRVELVVGDIAAALRTRAIDSGCYVVIVTRGHQNDEKALDAVIRSTAGYIGLIGSRRKSRLILDDLRAAGVPDELLARVHTPIGLPINAVTVPEIAVSIAAELVQVRRTQLPALVEGPVETQ
ncbi:putative xanthine dehydrogenase subunit A [Phycisphaerae bacterium RAS2]|nr:putative xanthine dehydrogenase subunit A [Phycisphaerae bacterium RAS2]